MTMGDLIKLLTDAGPGVATIAIVLYYMDRKDKTFTDAIRAFSNEIKNLSTHISFLGETNRELKNTHEQNVEENKELRKVLEEIYIHNAKKKGYKFKN